VRVGSDEIEFRVTSEESDGALTAAEVRIPPGGGPPMLHRHEPSELYRVERGELALYVEDGSGSVRRTVARPGTVVAIAAGREHTVRNESEAEASAFVVFTPGGQMERFFRAAGELGGDGPPAPEQVVDLAEAHGITMTRSVQEAF